MKEEDLETLSLIVDLLVRVNALESILISKKLLTQDELSNKIEKISENVSKSIDSIISNKK